MIAQRVNSNIPQNEITIDNIDSYYSPSEEALNNLEDFDIPRMQGILDKRMRIISFDQPTNPESGMAWFKLFN